VPVMDGAHVSVQRLRPARRVRALRQRRRIAGGAPDHRPPRSGRTRAASRGGVRGGASVEVPGGRCGVKKKPCIKKRYATLEEAKRAIEAMANRFPSVVYKKPYRCGPCKAWHITSTPPGRGRRIQR